MANDKCPCSGCNQRSPYCHAECDAYINWKKEHDARLKKYNENRQLGYRSGGDLEIAYRKCRKIRWDQ